jgi:hypothetical protein
VLIHGRRFTVSVIYKFVLRSLIQPGGAGFFYRPHLLPFVSVAQRMLV